MFHEGVNVRGLPITLISRLLAGHPAKRFGMEHLKGTIALGLDADFVLLNPNTTYTLAAEDLLYRHKHSPYIGRTLSCKVAATISRGRVVYTSEEGVLAEEGGQWLQIRKEQYSL